MGHDRIPRVHEAGGDLHVEDESFGNEPPARPTGEVPAGVEGAIPEFSQRRRIGYFFQLRARQSHDEMFAGDFPPWRAGGRQGFRPFVRVIATEHEHRSPHRAGDGHFDGGFGRGLFANPSVAPEGRYLEAPARLITRNVDVDQSAEGIGHRNFLRFHFKDPRNDRETPPFFVPPEFVVVTSDANLPSAGGHGRRHFHQDGFAGRGIESGALPTRLIGIDFHGRFDPFGGGRNRSGKDPGRRMRGCFARRQRMIPTHRPLPGLPGAFVIGRHADNPAFARPQGVDAFDGWLGHIRGANRRHGEEDGELAKKGKEGKFHALRVRDESAGVSGDFSAGFRVQCRESLTQPVRRSENVAAARRVFPTSFHP